MTVPGSPQRPFLSTIVTAWRAYLEVGLDGSGDGKALAALDDGSYEAEGRGCDLDPDQASAPDWCPGGSGKKFVAGTRASLFNTIGRALSVGPHIVS